MSIQRICFFLVGYRDMEHNSIRDLGLVVIDHNSTNKHNKTRTHSPLAGAGKLHDILLSHNRIQVIPRHAFKGLDNLKTL